MKEIESFINKYHGKNLEDWGPVMSEQFKKFQTSFFNTMRKIAKSMDAELVNPIRGHYYISGFIKKVDKYVYFNYSNFTNRAVANLKGDIGWNSPMLVRLADSDHDYTGHENHHTTFEKCDSIIFKLLN